MEWFEVLRNYMTEKNLTCIIQQYTDQDIVFRCNLNTDSDAHLFIKFYQEFTSTKWIVVGGPSEPRKIVFHKYWACEHSERNKKKSEPTPKNTNCEARIDILIKKNNRNTRKNDEYLRMTPPLNAKVVIKGVHNHSIRIGKTKVVRVHPDNAQVCISDEKSEKVNNNIKVEIKRLQNLLCDVPLVIRERVSRRLQRIKNSQQLSSFLLRCCKNNLVSIEERESCGFGFFNGSRAPMTSVHTPVCKEEKIEIEPCST